jgi:16S rRNA (adenine1518-N6/adenine1519-N6)-dimethyltransferase
MKAHPKRSLGQNFLVDPNYRRKVHQAIRGAYFGGPIVEIGPGHGALTEALVEFADELILIEKDHLLADELRTRFISNTKIMVLEADVLEVNPQNILAGKKALVVGNLPYNISSQIFIWACRYKAFFHRAIFMFQKEMAMRIVAKSDEREFGPLAVWAQVFGTASKLFDLPPGAFKPKPNVDSSIVSLVFNEQKFDIDAEAFLVFVRRLFLHRRKQMAGVLKSMGVDPLLVSQYGTVRAEVLSVAQLHEVFNLCRAFIN